MTHSIIGKTPKMMCWRTLDKTEDLKSAKDREFELIRSKGFNWRIKVVEN